MGKRQVVLFPHQFKQLPNFTQWPVDIILKNGTTYKGKIISLQSQELTLEKMNSKLEFARSKRITLNFEEIYQIYITTN